MNLIKRADKYIKRVKLAELMETSEVYLSELAKGTRPISIEMEARIKKAIGKIIKHLEKI